MQRAELEAYLTRKGWTKDRWGHFRKSTYRMKMQARSVRMESQVKHAAGQYSPASTSWVRLKSANYSALSITADDKLAGLKFGY